MEDSRQAQGISAVRHLPEMLKPLHEIVGQFEPRAENLRLAMQWQFLGTKGAGRRDAARSHSAIRSLRGSWNSPATLKTPKVPCSGGGRHDERRALGGDQGSIQSIVESAYISFGEIGSRRPSKRSRSVVQETPVADTRSCCRRRVAGRGDGWAHGHDARESSGRSRDSLENSSQAHHRKIRT